MSDAYVWAVITALTLLVALLVLANRKEPRP